MNRNLLILVALLLALILSWRLFTDQKRETLRSYNRYLTLKEKALKIEKLRTSLQKPPVAPKACKQKKEGKKIVYICKEVDSKHFTQIERTFFKKIVPLSQIDMKQTKRGVDVTLEVTQ